MLQLLQPSRCTAGCKLARRAVSRTSNQNRFNSCISADSLRWYVHTLFMKLYDAKASTFLAAEHMSSLIACNRQAGTQHETQSCCQRHRLLGALLLTSTSACPGALQTASRRQKAANSSPLLLTGPRITSANSALAVQQQQSSAAHELHGMVDLSAAADHRCDRASHTSAGRVHLMTKRMGCRVPLREAPSPCKSRSVRRVDI